MSESQQLRMDLPDTREVERVEEFKFEPIKGYPMLNWRGKRPFTSTRYYPAQLKEVHGEEVDGWLNKIYWGDNLQVMSHLLKEYRGQIQLIYIDPPFDSKADYKKKIRLKQNTYKSSHNAFEEKQYTDIWSNDDYLQFIYNRLIIARELLTENGSIFLHCGVNKKHQIRSILDEILGPEAFVNEVVRLKCNPKNSSIKAFGNIHDSVLFYRNCCHPDDIVWNRQREKVNSEDLQRIFEKTTPQGRRYTTVALHAPGERRGETGQPWRGVHPPSGRHWAYVHSKLDELDNDNYIEWSSSGVPRLIRYADEKKGNIVQDIWTMKDPQYAIYPTEKSEFLLERIIEATTNPDDIVFDFFMGSGTAQSASMKLCRRFLGADINLGAVQTTTKRLLSVIEEMNSSGRKLDLKADGSTQTRYYAGFEVYNVNHYDIFRNPLEAKDLLLEALEVHSLQKGGVFDGEKDGRMVKIMPVDRIATRADLNELTRGFDYKAFEKRQAEHPKKPVEHITLVCMGHESDLKAILKKEMQPYEIDIEVVDILRDRQDLHFKRDSEALVDIDDGELIIKQFYPMNLLSKLSLQQENVEDWRELVESVMIDWNYDGAVLEPKTVDIPGKNELVQGRYPVPDDAGTIKVKITDLLSESLEMVVVHG